MPLLDQAQRRQADTFVKDLRGGGIVGSSNTAADVRLVSAIADECEDLVIDEHRTADDPIREMVAAGHIGVARDEDVSRGNIPEGPQDGFYDQSAAASVDRDAVGLANQASEAIGKEA